MEHIESFTAVWAASLLVTVAGSLLDSVLISAVGVLAFALVLATAFTVWTVDLVDGTRTWTGSPDRVKK
jgi:Flp pilus assembly protein TadB